MPKTAPLMSFVTFSVISALASATSSRTSSWARSVTSWIARADLARWLLGHGYSAIFLRIRANRKAPGERGGHVQLGLLGSLDRGAGMRRGDGLRRARPSGGGGRLRVGAAAGRGHGGAGDRAGRAGPARERASSRSAAAAARACSASAAAACGARRPRGACAPSWTPPAAASAIASSAFASSSSARRSSVIASSSRSSRPARRSDSARCVFGFLAHLGRIFPEGADPNQVRGLRRRDRGQRRRGPRAGPTTSGA